MTSGSIGVAVVGGGPAGRAHAAGYRMASTLFGIDGPQVRLVAIADAQPAVAEDAARRYGYERAETSWQALAEADDVDAVSIVVANRLHREIAEGLLAAGKHVLCEKPLSDSLADAESMADAADASGLVNGIGYTLRRSPAVQAIRRELDAGTLGAPIHFDGRYPADYGLDPESPMTWRYRGGPGSGALGDLGSHLVDLGEYLFGPVAEVSGAVFATVNKTRPIPLGVTYGHEKAAVSDEREAVDNEDVATFTARFEGGSVGTFSVSRVAHTHADGLSFDLYGTGGSASWRLSSPAEFQISTGGIGDAVNGSRRVVIGPNHPLIKGGLPMDSGGAGHGKAEFFAYQARAFLDQIAAHRGRAVEPLPGLEPLPDFRHGLRGMKLAAAIAESARCGGASVAV